jgi:ribosomal protein L12E/L44/L45/RPP1/RPP2
MASTVLIVSIYTHAAHARSLQPEACSIQPSEKRRGEEKEKKKKRNEKRRKKEEEEEGSLFFYKV